MKKIRTIGKEYIGVGVGGLILNKKNEVLLLLRNVDPEKNFWSIPGGQVEFGEKVEDALIRELKEELGIDVAVINLLCVTNHILSQTNTHWISPAYYVKIISGIPLNKEKNKHLEMKWFPVNDLPANLAIPAINAIKNYKLLYNQ